MIDDPITFEVMKNSLISAAMEMSLALRRAAFSPNIKERRDCSSAIFDDQGRLIAQSKDIPVHLGAMPLSVRACIQDLRDQIVEGAMLLVNDPYSGGSHLPDLTLVAPVYKEDQIFAFVANRAHHADVGGKSPGSMPGLSTSLDEEGVVIRPRVVVKQGVLDRGAISDLMKVTRTPQERLGDFSAQIAANNVGKRRMGEIITTYGLERTVGVFSDLTSYSRSMMRRALSNHDGARSHFIDFMDSDGAGTWRIPISVEITIEDGCAHVDFTGSAEQVSGNINCPLASTLSSVYFSFIALMGSGVPVNEGCWETLRVDVPAGSLLNPRFPAAVAAGNVETTQRIVDTILGAMASITPDLVPAASQGTMNNLAIGGLDERTGTEFTFYETIGGGAGAARGTRGESGIHSNMTNTLNTPIEALESSYPLRVRRYCRRASSGGRGQWSGGDGIVREIEILSDNCTASLQSERRHTQPWGLMGGLAGKPGRNSLIYDSQEHEIQAKSSLLLPRGAIIRIETPGGGGWGAPPTPHADSES